MDGQEEKRVRAGRSRGHSTGGGWRAFCKGYSWKWGVSLGRHGVEGWRLG